jgi:hypothetical protein
VLKPIRLDRQHEPLLIIDLNFGHVHAWNVEHRTGPGAPARARATHTVGHRRGLRQIARSHLILKVPAPSPHDQHAQSSGCSIMLNCEDPVIAGILGSGVRARSYVRLQTRCVRSFAGLG